MEGRGGSLNKEVEWRQWFSGTQGVGGENIEENGDNVFVESRGGSSNKKVKWRQ